METLLLFTNLPDPESARRLAERLVTEQLAACVSILPSCRSIYRWQGTLEQAEEVPLLVKTTAVRYAQVEAAIRAGHPYELPEIIAVPVTHGLPGYLAWVAAETTAESFADPSPT